MKKIIVILSLVMTPLLLLGQEGNWSLEKCIEYAYQNNLQLKQQEIMVEQSENTLLQSKLDYIPSFSGSVGHSMNWGRSVNINDLQIVQNQLSQSTSANVGASVTLFEGLSKVNTVKSNQTALEISKKDVEKLRNDISISITRAFLQVLLSKELLKTTQENFKSISEQRERTSKLVEAGSQAYSTLLEMESQLAAERVQLVNATNQLKNNLLSLMQILDLGFDNHFDIYAPDFNIDGISPSFENIENLFQLSMELPQIKGAELALQKSQYQLSAAKGRLYPTISLSAGYGTYFSSLQNKKFFDQFNENRNPSVSLSLSIPIFNQLSRSINVRNAKLAVRNSELELKNRHQTLYKEVQQAVTDAMGYYQKYLASKENLKAMQESFRYVEQKFDVGTLNGTDYTVAKTNLYKAQSDFYQSKYQFIFQLKIIDFYKGIPISL